MRAAGTIFVPPHFADESYAPVRWFVTGLDDNVVPRELLRLRRRCPLNTLYMRLDCLGL